LPATWRRSIRGRLKAGWWRRLRSPGVRHRGV
jgi:hypothetical protein